MTVKCKLYHVALLALLVQSFTIVIGDDNGTQFCSIVHILLSSNSRLINLDGNLQIWIYYSNIMGPSTSLDMIM